MFGPRPPRRSTGSCTGSPRRSRSRSAWPDALRARTDDVPLLVEAQLHIARGEHDAAVTLLRRSRRTEQSTRLLVGALIGVGDIDNAVEELRTAANRFNDTTHLVRAVEVLGQADRLDDAAVLAAEALQRVPRTLREA